MNASCLKWGLFPMAAVLLLLGARATAVGQTDDKDQGRLEQLELRVRTLEKELANKEGGAASESRGGLTDEGLKFRSKYPITFTGFVKADFVFGTSRVNSTDAPRYAVSEPSGADSHDDFFNATVEHSRLVTRWSGPEVLEEGKLDARLEMDFFTLNDTGDAKFNNNQLRVRELYANLAFPSWSLLAGQAWDLFSPLAPTTFNTNGYFWFGGNAGFRRPQLRVTAWGEPVEEHRILGALSLNANIGRTRLLTAGGGTRTVNSGEDAGTPVVEGMLEYRFPMKEGGSGTLGISGVYGREELDGVSSEIDQYGVGAHASLPVLEHLTLKGEIQRGRNTDAFLMGGGFDETGDEIQATSGWAQASYEATDEVTLHLAYGAEKFDSADVSVGDRRRNDVVAAGASVSPTDDLTFGVEYFHFDTEYKASSGGSANLLWLSVVFHF